MTKIRRSVLAVLVLGAFVAVLPGCKKNDGPAERAGKEIDKAADKTGEQINKAVDKAGEKMEKAGEKMRDAAKDGKK